MDRRSTVGLIAIVVIVAVAMFAGCVEEEKAATSINTPPEVTPIDIYASDETTTLLIKTTLSDYGIRDVTAQVADGRENGGTKSLILSYRSTALTENEIAAEMGFIIGVYLGAVEGGWDIDELSVVVGDINGNAAGIWYCTKDWTNDYRNGKMSMGEVLIKVISSMTPF